MKLKHFLLCVVLLLPIFQTTARNIEMVISAPLETVTLTKVEARNLFLLKTKVWKDGVRVTVLRLPSDHPIHREFVNELLGMSAEQYNAEWNKLSNAGITSTVEVLDTPGEMLRVINRRHNAIGYISKDYLLLNVGGYDVKVISVVD